MKGVKAVAVLFSGLTLSGGSQADFSANVGLTNNYLWRGVTQTGDDPAISGGLDYEHDSGLFIGTWASNVDFGDASGGDAYEWDIYAGYAGTISVLDYTVALTHYYYPDIDDAHFTELSAEVAYGVFAFGAAYTVDSNEVEPAPFTEDDIYVYGSLSFDLGNDWGLSASAGYYDFSDDGRAAIESYGHGQLDLSKALGKFGDVTATVSIAEEESGDDDPIFVISWTKSFSF